MPLTPRSLTLLQSKETSEHAVFRIWCFHKKIKFYWTDLYRIGPVIPKIFLSDPSPIIGYACQALTHPNIIPLLSPQYYPLLSPQYYPSIITPILFHLITPILSSMPSSSPQLADCLNTYCTYRWQNNYLHYIQLSFEKEFFLPPPIMLESSIDWSQLELTVLRKMARNNFLWSLNAFYGNMPRISI